MKNLPDRIRASLAPGLLGVLLCILAPALQAEERIEPTVEVFGNRVSISLRDVELAEAVELLSRRGRRNIILADGITGTVSVNLYDVTIDQAVRIIAEGAGHAMEFRNNTWYIIKRDDAGKYTESGHTVVRTFGIQYSDVNVVSTIVKEQLSHWGKVTVLPGRGLLVVRDRPEFIERITDLISEVDHEPQQVLIEARLLEVTLDDTQAAGVDWARVVNTPSNSLLGIDKGAGTLEARTQSVGTTGLFFQFFTPELGLTLEALETKGRVRTLSTPTLLALENKESHVIIGDRLGYRVTTTINQVTTESIEFLDSGVILRVTPSVDREGRILMTIHPQVSTGVIQNGIPSLSTTEVTTTLLIPDGQTTFIGGLLRQGITETRDGIPFLSDLPLIGGLFGSETKTNLRTETIALITPYVVREGKPRYNNEQVEKATDTERILDRESDRIQEQLNESRSGFLHPANPSAPEEPPEPPAPAIQPAPADDAPLVPKVRVTPLPDATQSIQPAPDEPDMPLEAGVEPTLPEPAAAPAAKPNMAPTTAPPSPATTQPVTPVPSIVPVALPAELPTGKKVQVEGSESEIRAADPGIDPASAPASEPKIDNDIERLMRIWGQSARR